MDEVENLDRSCCDLQKEVNCKDRRLEALHDEVEKLHCQLGKVCQENRCMAEKVSKQKGSSPGELKCQLQAMVTNAGILSSHMQDMESTLSELRCEMENLKKEQKVSVDFKSKSCIEPIPCATKPPCNFSETANIKKLKCLQNQYATLQGEYCRKEKESKDLADRLKTFLDSCEGDKDKAENSALRTRAGELESEIDDLKVFIKELQEQVDSYREKFMKGE